MSFQIEAGTDLYGTKQNCLINFTQQPQLADFISNVQAQFDVKARASRPAGYPDIPFQVETLQIFGDQGSWVDLQYDSQLRPGSQVWVFQPECIWHSDAQGVIPKAESVATWAPKQGSPSRKRAERDSGCPPTLVEKMTAVFHEIDGQGKAYLLREDIERAFHRAEIQFHAHGQGLFTTADLDRSGHVTWDEWQQYAIKNPSVVDALFFRLRDAPQFAPLVPTSRHALPAPEHYANPPPPQQYSAPPQHYSQQSAPYSAAPPPPQSYAAPPQSHYQSPVHRASPAQYSHSGAPSKSYEQEVREYIDQTSPERTRSASPSSRLPSQDYMNKALAQAGSPAAQSPQPYLAGQHPAPPPHVGAGSPSRNAAMQEYEAARRRADQARLQKEDAERDERSAWDRLYKSN